jgi:lipopolysaccharide biosynthesis glycosyltransferase
MNADSVKSGYIPIMHCFDNNFVIPAAVSFYSMLDNANPRYDYKLYVLHSDITVRNQDKLKELVSGFPPTHSLSLSICLASLRMFGQR